MSQTPGSGTRFPTALDDFTMPTPLNYMDLISHSGEHDDINAAVMAVEAKLGAGNSVPSLNAIFVGTGAGTSAWTNTLTFDSLTVLNGITVNAGGISVAGNSAIAGTLGITGALTLNNYAAHTVLIGEAASAVVGVAPAATAGIALVSQGNAADPTYSTVVVAGGGTGLATLAAYAVVCGGTTSTDALQQVASLGTSGQVLTSSGPGALPAWTTFSATATNVLANLLTNPGFEISQRTLPVTANNAYAHDRWQNLLGGTSTISITNETTIVDTGSGNALKAVYVQGTANSQINQKLEGFKQLRGQPLAFSIRVRQGVANNIRPYISDSGAKTFGVASPVTGGFVTITVALPVGAAATSVNVGVDAGASDTYYLDNAMLVVGSVPVDYVPLIEAEEWARCQRYYRIIGGASGGDINVYGRNTNGANLGELVWTTTYPVMATIPTATKVGTWTINNVGQPTVRSAGATGISLTAVPTAAGDQLFYNSGTGMYIALEANP